MWPGFSKTINQDFSYRNWKYRANRFVRKRDDLGDEDDIFDYEQLIDCETDTDDIPPVSQMLVEALCEYGLLTLYDSNRIKKTDIMRFREDDSFYIPPLYHKMGEQPEQKTSTLSKADENSLSLKANDIVSILRCARIGRFGERRGRSKKVSMIRKENRKKRERLGKTRREDLSYRRRKVISSPVHSCLITQSMSPSTMDNVRRQRLSNILIAPRKTVVASELVLDSAISKVNYDKRTFMGMVKKKDRKALYTFLEKALSGNVIQNLSNMFVKHDLGEPTPATKRESSDILIAKLFGEETPFMKRRIEAEWIAEMEEDWEKYRFFPLRALCPFSPDVDAESYSTFTLPRVLMKRILGYCPKGLSYMNSVALVNSSWYMLALESYVGSKEHPVVISGGNVRHIPLLVLRNALHIRVWSEIGNDVGSRIDSPWRDFNPQLSGFNTKIRNQKLSVRERQFILRNIGSRCESLQFSTRDIPNKYWGRTLLGGRFLPRYLLPNMSTFQHSFNSSEEKFPNLRILDLGISHPYEFLDWCFFNKRFPCLTHLIFRYDNIATWTKLKKGHNRLRRALGAGMNSQESGDWEMPALVRSIVSSLSKMERVKRIDFVVKNPFLNAAVLWRNTNGSPADTLARSFMNNFGDQLIASIASILQEFTCATIVHDVPPTEMKLMFPEYLAPGHENICLHYSSNETKRKSVERTNARNEYFRDRNISRFTLSCFRLDSKANCVICTGVISDINSDVCGCVGCKSFYCSYKCWQYGRYLHREVCRKKKEIERHEREILEKKRFKQDSIANKEMEKILKVIETGVFKFQDISKKPKAGPKAGPKEYGDDEQERGPFGDLLLPNHPGAPNSEIFMAPNEHGSEIPAIEIPATYEKKNKDPEKKNKEEDALAEEMGNFFAFSDPFVMDDIPSEDTQGSSSAESETSNKGQEAFFMPDFGGLSDSSLSTFELNRPIQEAENRDGRKKYVHGNKYPKKKKEVMRKRKKVYRKKRKII